VSDVSDAVVDFYVVTNDLHKSTGEKQVAGMWESRRGLSHETAKVQTITLDRLLEAERVERVDFLSMDIEMHEPQALAGFDITPGTGPSWSASKRMSPCRNESEPTSRRRNTSGSTSTFQ
jgi:hypothetical protein